MYTGLRLYSYVNNFLLSVKHCIIFSILIIWAETTAVVFVWYRFNRVLRAVYNIEIIYFASSVFFSLFFFLIELFFFIFTYGEFISSIVKHQTCFNE